MYIVNIAKAIKKMSISEIEYLETWISLETIIKFGFSKESIYQSIKRLKKRFIVACRQINKKIPDPHNAKENYHQFIRNKNIKSEIVACQPKSFENPNIADIKSVITEH